MKVKSESEVAQLCPTPSDLMDCSPPGPSVHGIFQARELEWGAIAFSDEYAKTTELHTFFFFFFGHIMLDLSSPIRDGTHSPCSGRAGS